MTRTRAALGVGILAIVSCGDESRTPAGAGGPLFVEVSERSGVDFRVETGARGERYMVETMLGGLAWIDHDGDGDLDLYLVNGHGDAARAAEPGDGRNRLYRNDGDWRFTDVTDTAGVGDQRYGNGAAVGDFDNDGDSDLLVTNFGRNTLYRNEGDGEFRDVTESVGLDSHGAHSSATWMDFDGDGDLDLYVVRYVRYDPRLSRSCEERGQRVYCHPRFFAGDDDLLYRNDGARFVEIGREAGIRKSGPHEGKGLGVIAFDFDRDGDTDIYVANDTTPNFLWRNNRDGTFTDVAHESGVALSADGLPEAGMGVDVADVNADGVLDIVVTNFSRETNALYIGREDRAFVDQSARSLGATFAPLGFGVVLADVDLDGDADLVVANGHVNDLVERTDASGGSSYRQSPSLLLNDGSGRFQESRRAGGAFFSQRIVGRGLASADVDNDGDVDLAFSRLDGRVALLENRNPTGSRGVTIRLRGIPPSPRDAYGAMVTVHAGGSVRTHTYQSGRSYLSAIDPRLVIAVPGNGKIDRLEITWPSGRRRTIIDPEGLAAGVTRAVLEIVERETGNEGSR